MPAGASRPIASRKLAQLRGQAAQRAASQRAHLLGTRDRRQQRPGSTVAVQRVGHGISSRRLRHARATCRAQRPRASPGPSATGHRPASGRTRNRCSISAAASSGHEQREPGRLAASRAGLRPPRATTRASATHRPGDRHGQQRIHRPPREVARRVAAGAPAGTRVAQVAHAEEQVELRALAHHPQHERRSTGRPGSAASQVSATHQPPSDEQRELVVQDRLRRAQCRAAPAGRPAGQALRRGPVTKPSRNAISCQAQTSDARR